MNSCNVEEWTLWHFQCVCPQPSLRFFLVYSETSKIIDPWGSLDPTIHTSDVLEYKVRFPLKILFTSTFLHFLFVVIAIVSNVATAKGQRVLECKRSGTNVVLGRVLEGGPGGAVDTVQAETCTCGPHTSNIVVSRCSPTANCWYTRQKETRR